MKTDLFTCFTFLVRTSSKHGKENKCFISSSRNPLFKTIGGVVLLLPLLAYERNCIFYYMLQHSHFFRLCFIAAIHLSFVHLFIDLTFLEHSLPVTGKEGYKDE